MPKSKVQKQKEAIERNFTGELRYIARRIYAHYPGHPDHQRLKASGYSQPYMMERYEESLQYAIQCLHKYPGLIDFAFSIQNKAVFGYISQTTVAEFFASKEVAEWICNKDSSLPFYQDPVAICKAGDETNKKFKEYLKRVADYRVSKI